MAHVKTETAWVRYGESVCVCVCVCVCGGGGGVCICVCVYVCVCVCMCVCVCVCVCVYCVCACVFFGGRTPPMKLGSSSFRGPQITKRRIQFSIRCSLDTPQLEHIYRASET